MSMSTGRPRRATQTVRMRPDVIRGFSAVIKRRCGFRPQIRTGCAGAVGVRFYAVPFLRQYGPATGGFALDCPAAHIWNNT